jgi:D-alanyl-D-alanine carboxypeptidase (penicillin-binding protein 5/6)
MKWSFFLTIVGIVVFVHILFFSCVMRDDDVAGDAQSETVETSGESTEVASPSVEGGATTATTEEPVVASTGGIKGLPSTPLTEGLYMKSLLEMPAKLATDTELCKAGICIDLNARKILWEKNSRQAYPIASMTKMMTVYVVAKELRRPGGNVTLETPVKATVAASKVGGHQIWIDQRETFTVDELLKCILIHSANDCAYLLAEFLGGGSEAEFVKKMDAEAKQLGMVSFDFRNSHGLYEMVPGANGKTVKRENMGSAFELAHLSSLLLDIPEVVRWSSTKRDCIRENNPKFKKFDLHSTNKLLNDKSCPGVNGMKTGMTEAAGSCITATCEREGRRIVVVVMGCEKSAIRDKLVRQLINWAYSQK